MKLKLVRHLWGVDLKSGLEPHLPRWREVGYEAVETPWRSLPDRPAFLRFLQEHRLAVDCTGLQPRVCPGRNSAGAP